MKTPKNLFKTSFRCMFLLTIMSVFLFPGSIQASKYSVTIDPLSESGERTGKRFWEPKPDLASNGGLSESADWSAVSGQDSAWFGVSVGTAGDVNGDGISDVIVGAYLYGTGDSSDINVNAGRVYVFYGSADGLSTIPAWTAESDQAGAFFGCSVGTAGDVNGDGYSDVIVGAFGEDKAYVFYGSANGLSTIPAWTAESDQTEAGLFGISVGTAGNVNNDRYSDVIVGAPYYKNFGGVFVYYGSADGLSKIPAWTAVYDSDQNSPNFGRSVGTAGDVNNDGISDIIVGAYGENKVYVFYGSDSDEGMSTAADWEATGPAGFGFSVGTAGDVNGDGISDVIVGTYDEGKAYVFHGSADGLLMDPGENIATTFSAAWTAESVQTDAYFGRSVGTAGDVNNDGISDVIVGAYGEDRAYVYHGSVEGLSLTADWTGEPDQSDARFGISVGTAGDVNGDEISDVIVGAPMYDNSETDEDNGGRAFAYYGSSDAICFIGTASYGSHMKPQIGFVTTMALMFFLLAGLIGFMECRKIKK